MKVTSFGPATINSDGSITVTVTVEADNAIEATFLGFAAATIQGINSTSPDPVATILQEARALNITLPA